MLKLRVKKLLNNIEAINSEYPGIVLAEVSGCTIPGVIHKALENELRNKIRRNLNAIRDLTLLSESDVTLKLVERYSKFNIDSPPPIQTEAYGKIIGIDASPYLYDYLLSINFIYRSNSSYKLTTKGEQFGGYLEDEYGNISIGWNKYLLDIQTDKLKLSLLDKLQFRLFHMTHIDNLPHILEQGLLSHSKVSKYINISDRNVNSLRDRTEHYHNFKIHDYVPFYFNPRNAMLYRMQKEHHDKIVILEVDKKIVIKDYTLFSMRNAARKDSKLISCKYDLLNFPWSDIYADSWTVNGISNDDKKSIMQSECLISNHVPVDMIKTIHCNNKNMQLSISEKLEEFNKEFLFSPQLFF